jgi:hypothetical protein
MSNKKQVIEFVKDAGAPAWVSSDEAVFEINDAVNDIDHAMFMDEQTQQGNLVSSVSLDPSGKIFTIVRLWNAEGYSAYNNIVETTENDDIILDNIRNTLGINVNVTVEDSVFGP